MLTTLLSLYLLISSAAALIAGCHFAFRWDRSTCTAPRGVHAGSRAALAALLWPLLLALGLGVFLTRLLWPGTTHRSRADAPRVSPAHDERRHTAVAPVMLRVDPALVA